MSPLLRRRSQIVIKQEAVAGTAEALAAADVMLHTGVPEWEPNVEMVPRDAMSASLSPRGTVRGSKAGQIKWKQYLRPTGDEPTDPANLPDFNVPFQGCGAEVTVSGADPAGQASYKPTTSLVLDATSGAYCTVALYEDGKIYKLHGAQGNCKLTYQVGSPVLAEFEFTGVWNTPIDGALLSPTYSTVVEPAFLDAAFSIVGFATAKIKTFTVDFGNQIVMRPNPNDTSGFFTAQIVARTPVGTLDPEEMLVATKDLYAEWIAGTTGAITTGVFPSGGSNYSQFQMTIAKAGYLKVGKGDRDGIATAPVEFECQANSDAGEDEWEFIMT